MRNYNNIAVIILSSAISFIAAAQKLPQIQETGVRAPEGIKVDGRLTEWKTTPDLAAYNPTDRINYVISNDDDNLYFTMRGLGTRVSLKALQGGVTLTISHSVDKRARIKMAGNVSVTFPYHLDDKTIGSVIGRIYALNGVLNDSVANRKQVDSIVTFANKRVGDAVKEIKIKGIKDIPDTVISIFNTDGIKAAMLFIKRMPVIEIAVPLKYLELSVNNSEKFSYNIKFIGDLTIDNDEPIGIRKDLSLSAPAVINGTAGMRSAPAPNPDEEYSNNPTDFWGTYALVKKN